MERRRDSSGESVKEENERWYRKARLNFLEANGAGVG
jgi:hypothetical protein